jgi:hypothetical protein
LKIKLFKIITYLQENIIDCENILCSSENGF